MLTVRRALVTSARRIFKKDRSAMCGVAVAGLATAAPHIS